MLSKLADEFGSEATTPMFVRWESADEEFLKKAWFFGKLEKIICLIKAQGRKAGLATNVQFFVSPWMADHNGPETILVISVERASVPFLVPLELAWNEELTFKSFSQHLVARTKEVIDHRDKLANRLQAIAEAAQEATRELGHGAAVCSLFYEASRFDEPCVHIQQPWMKILIKTIGDDLREKIEEFAVTHPAALTSEVGMFTRQQSYRAEALERRRANPGKIEIERLALQLLSLTDLKFEDVANVANGHAVPWNDGLIVGGAELTRLMFFMSAGRITTNFYFEGGYYHSGSVILFEDVPQSLQQALIGRPINEVISGGIFDIVSPKIIGLGTMTEGTQFKVETLPEWVECPCACT